MIRAQGTGTPSMSAIRTRPQAAGDQGAVAVIVAVLSLVLIGMAAFAVDFGNAYSIKRQLSVAADASALAAAQDLNALLPYGTTCDSSVLTPTATATATKVNSQNDLSGQSTVSSVRVDCTAAGVEVTVENTRKVPTIFGGIFGVGSTDPSTSATAILQVPAGLTGGMRPIVACITNVTDAFSSSSNFLVFISKKTAACGTSRPSEWGYVNFLDQGADRSLIGTSHAFGTAFMAGTPAFFNPGLNTGTCNAGSVNGGGAAGCQSEWYNNGYAGPFFSPNTTVAGNGNTGLMENSGLVASTKTDFTGLVGKVIQLPVVTSLDTTLGRFNVVGVVTAFVCAANWTGTPTAGDPSCTPPLPPSWTNGVSVIGPTDAALWLEPREFVTTGEFGGSSCVIGDKSCDFGTRSVSLYK